MIDLTHIAEWQKLPQVTRQRIFATTSRRVGLPSVFAAEKDWWAAQTLFALFSMECADALLFKGGTSLSKGWQLLQRFSEDIDLAINREFLGFKGELKKADIRKLRRISYQYIKDEFTPALQKRFLDIGFPEVEIIARATVNHDQDPVIIEVYYPKMTEIDTYIKPGVLVEIGCRSMNEPYTLRTVNSLVSQAFPEMAFSEKPALIPVVNPERTFLEKIFLLHEEFQRPPEKMRVNYLSRHLYDIEILSKTEFAELALRDGDLFASVVNHRRIYSPVSGVDYTKHQPGFIQIIPPKEVLPLWERDYELMRERMIYGKSKSFDVLISGITALQNRINQKET
jgi:hypothetical protein